MNSTIYIKGDIGFKPVVLTKLGGTWIHGVEDCEENILGFYMPENILLEDFKNSIGSNNIIAYNLFFLNQHPSETLSELSPKFIPGKAIKMSIWANKSYNLNKQ